MSFAFLHGEILIGWFSMGALALLIALVVGFWWRWRPPRGPIVPTAIYLLLALLGSAIWMSDTSNLLLSSLGFALTLPWSALFLFAVMSFDIQIPAWAILPGIPLNSVLIYFAARTLAKRKLGASDEENLQFSNTPHP